MYDPVGLRENIHEDIVAATVSDDDAYALGGQLHGYLAFGEHAAPAGTALSGADVLFDGVPRLYAADDLGLRVVRGAVKDSVHIGQDDEGFGADHFGYES